MLNFCETHQRMKYLDLVVRKKCGITLDQFTFLIGLTTDYKGTGRNCVKKISRRTGLSEKSARYLSEVLIEKKFIISDNGTFYYRDDAPICWKEMEQIIVDVQNIWTLITDMNDFMEKIDIFIKPETCGSGEELL